MDPTAGILMSISTLTARKVSNVHDGRGQRRVNYVVVVLTSTLALGLALARPDALANFLLLTYSGSVQLAPANLIGLTRMRTSVSRGRCSTV
jgi:solute:Na+ symporter, SSS family